MAFTTCSKLLGTLHKRMTHNLVIIYYYYPVHITFCHTWEIPSFVRIQEILQSCSEMGYDVFKELLPSPGASEGVKYWGGQSNKFLTNG